MKQYQPEEYWHHIRAAEARWADGGRDQEPMALYEKSRGMCFMCDLIDTKKNL